VSPRDALRRRVFPRAVIRLSTVRGHRRAAARVRRALGGRARIDLYVAFDDASSAVALVGLAERVAARRVRLVVEPVVARGIPGDPAAADKRRYAVSDARRLARRDGRELSRTEPVAPEATAFLAAWAAAAPAGVKRAAFSTAAMRRLWFESAGPVDPGAYVALWREHVGGDPPSDGAYGIRRSERAMRLRRLYDTPVAVTGGEWFFAHERLAQIEEALDDLGWAAA
jgi:2-hydroxychromene-2-carboxylate isomerase